MNAKVNAWSDTSAAPVIHRTVMPRKPQVPRMLPIIAVGDDCVFVERTGKVIERKKLTTLIATEPSSLIVSSHVTHLVQELDFFWCNDPRWQFKATPVVREIYQPNRQKSKWTAKSTVIGFFGFSDLSKKGKHRYHYPLDPADFLFRKTIHELRPEDRDIAEKCYLWGRDIRDWVIKQGLKPSPTVGGLAAQLLRDPRFYPEARRKVPRSTNATARPRLPGNYYELLVAPNAHTYSALYLDQTASHHNCALHLRFPHADKLRAKGHFTLQKKLWAPEGSERLARIEREHGLLYLELDVPNLSRFNHFPPPYMRHPGVTRTWVYTNELKMIRELGATVNGVIAAWTSPTVDTGLNEYAYWALQEIANSSPERRRWLKPALLAPYGILAAVPRPLEHAYRRADAGETVMYPVGSGHLKVKRTVLSASRESSIANVIHRGMIEAECRTRTITYARDLTLRGYEVLALYADSLFLRSVAHGASVVPPLPFPWKIEARLSELEFLSATTFVARELRKLPGVHGELRDAYAQSSSIALARTTALGRNIGLPAIDLSAASCAGPPVRRGRLPRVKSSA